MYITIATWLIKIGVGLLLVSFGAHQLKNPKHWIEEYIPLWIRNLFSIFMDVIMRLHALVNLVLGLLLLSGYWSLWVSIVSLAWLLSILPFAFKRSWKTGMRDLAINFAMAALVALLA